MAKKTPYTLIDTAGQTTAVIAVPVTRNKQSKVAKPLMDLVKNIGQVCFIESNGELPRLQMMGNELSVNGCAAGAFYWLQKNEKRSGLFTTSGDGLTLRADIKKSQIELSFSKRLIKKSNRNTVSLRGINYLLVPGIARKIIDPELKKKLIALSRNYPASGIIFYKRNRIQPLVYVKATKTFAWETSCGSGSIAYSFFSGVKKIKQPSAATIEINISDSKIIYATTARMLR